MLIIYDTHNLRRLIYNIALTSEKMWIFDNFLITDLYVYVQISSNNISCIAYIIINKISNVSAALIIFAEKVFILH